MRWFGLAVLLFVLVLGVAVVGTLLNLNSLVIGGVNGFLTVTVLSLVLRSAWFRRAGESSD